MVKLVNTEYVVFTDSDCIVKEDWIYKILESIKKNNYPDLIQGAYYHPFKDDFFSKSESEWDQIRFFVQKQADSRNIIFKTKSYLFVEGYNSDHFYSFSADDLFMMEKFLKNNLRTVLDKDIIVYHDYVNFFGELKRYKGFGKGSIIISKYNKNLFNKEFSPSALWKNLFTFRFGLMGIREFLYQFCKLIFFTQGYFIGKRHYQKEILFNKRLIPEDIKH